MASQCTLPDTWSAFSGLPLYSRDGSRLRQYPYDPWFMSYAWPNVGAVIALWGHWPGDDRFRPIWPHGLVGLPGPVTIYYWDMILGDGFAMVESTFNSHFGILIMANDTLGIFTPYT